MGCSWGRLCPMAEALAISVGYGGTGWAMGWATRGACGPQGPTPSLCLAGLRALSLTKRQAVTLAPSWSHGLVAAFEPYLVSANGTALLLWDRRTLALVLSMPAAGVQGVVAFVGSELQAGKSGHGFVPGPGAVPDGAGWPVVLRAGAGCLAAGGYVGCSWRCLECWDGTAPNPGSCSCASASATKQGVCPAAPSTCDHHYEDNHKYHCCSAHYLHHKTYTKQDHRCAHHYSCTNQQGYHITNHHQPVHINQDHPSTNYCPDHTNQDHHCATSCHHHHQHSVLDNQDHYPTANYYHPASNQSCMGSATYSTPPIQPCTPPDPSPPSLLSSHACALP